MKNHIAHRTDRFVVLRSIVLRVPVNMVNYLPLESAEAAIATCVIVTRSGTSFYFFPHSLVFLVSNDTSTGLTFDHNMEIQCSPSPRRCELWKELFVFRAECLFLRWHRRALHVPIPARSQLLATPPQLFVKYTISFSGFFLAAAHGR